MSNSLASLPSGTRLQNGAYAVGQVLGQGGFGITYKGGDMANKRYVAIKEFFPAGVARQNMTVVLSGITAEVFGQGKSDFLREAQTLKRFQDTSIVRVLGIFEENNSAYMVMEYLEGQTLAARIADKGALDEWEVLDIGLRLAGALQIVHEAGILHRDIKPENVMLTRSGRAVLIDFGTARAFESGPQRMTQIVTPGYAPIEQYASSARRGPTTDVYALGATLYHALSGVRPVAAPDRAADVPLPLLSTLRPGITPVITAAIMRALEMDATRRPQSAGDFAARLQGRLQPEPTPSLDDFFDPQRSPVPTAGHKPSTPASPTRHFTPPGASSTADETDGGPQILLHNTLERHTAPVNTLTFLPDGQRMVSAGVDRMVCVWNCPMNALNSHFAAHEQTIQCIALSPDGTWLATGGRDEQVRIWDGTLPSMPRRLPLAILNDCQGVVHQVAFCPTRRELVVGDAGAVTLWDATTGLIKARRETNGLSVSWSPDGSMLAVGGVLDGNLHILNGEGLTPRTQLQAHQGDLMALSFSPDGTMLATSGSDGFLRLWNVAQGAVTSEQRLSTSCFAWSPDSRILAVASREIVLLLTHEGRLWRRYTRHKGPIQDIAFSPVAAAPFRYMLASASRDKTIDLCRIKGDVGL